MSNNQKLIERGNEALIGNYARQPIAMARGEGAYVFDADGKKYLDLFAGFGGCILGHCHPALIAAATEQAKTLWHVGNSFYSEPQIEFAEQLKRAAFKGQAFFCHSGAEANEAACKLARLRGRGGGGDRQPRRWKIISLTGSFHGRTLAMIAATGNQKIREGFAPDVPGFINVQAGDYDALVAAIDDETAGIIMEPIQGEGGVNLYPAGYLARVRKLCDERGLTLIFDEVWTGGGRTGRWFAHQHFTHAADAAPEREPSGSAAGSAARIVEPDIMTLGKAVGGGLPVGVMYAKPEIAKLLGPGKHGSTLGGNAICMAVARTIFQTIEREKLLDHAAALGEHALSRLRNEPKVAEKVAEIRGRGLMLGMELKDEPQKVVEKGLERGVVLNLTAKKVIRLAPPINISREQWDQGLDLVIETICAC